MTKPADQFAIFYKPLRNEADAERILVVMSNITYVATVMLLTFAVIDKFGVALALTTFLFGYSLPRQKSRFVSAILLIFFVQGVFFAFYFFSFKISLMHWFTIIVSLIQPAILICMLLGLCFAFRSIQATFFFHRIKNSRIDWKNVFILIVMTVVVFCFMGVFIGFGIYWITSAEISESSKYCIGDFSLSFSCMVEYFLIKKFPTVRYVNS